MKYQEYIAYVEEAKGYSSAREFLGEYGFPPDCPYTPEGLIKFCDIIFAASRQDLKTLAELGAKSRDEFARAHHISPRTYRNWTYKSAIPPVYIAELIGYSMLEDLPKAEPTPEEYI